MKKLSKGKVVSTARLMSDMSASNVNRIPTGSMEIDRILDGGYPCGHMTEIYGPESSGKTTLAIPAMINGQKQGRPAAIIDAEHTLDGG